MQQKQRNMNIIYVQGEQNRTGISGILVDYLPNVITTSIIGELVIHFAANLFQLRVFRSGA